MSSDHGRMGVCEVCESAPSKYCCPGCGFKSCSLSCVKTHKKTSGCSGVRCKTKFVSINSFTDSHLLNDYYFLEDVGRVIDVSKRESKFTRRKQSDSYKKQHHLSWVCRHAGHRGTVVKLLPEGMTKHSLNTSRTVRDPARKSWLIHWRVHLQFTLVDIMYQEESVSEVTVLRDLLDRYIHPSSSDPIARHRLKSYVSQGGTDGVEVWLEGKMGVAIKKLDVDAQLRENFRHCTITEFPTFLVGIKGLIPASTAARQVSIDRKDTRIPEDQRMEVNEVASVERDSDLSGEVCVLEEGEVEDETDRRGEDAVGGCSEIVSVERDSDLPGEVCVLEEGEVEDETDRHGEDAVGGCSEVVGGHGKVCTSLHLIADSYSQSEGSDQD